MAFSIFKQRWLRITLSTLAVILTIVIVAVFVITQCFKPILKEKINDALAKGSGGLYKIDFADASVNLLLGRVALTNVTLTPDTAVFNLQKKSKAAPESIYRLKVNKLVINNLHSLKLYFKHRLNIGDIVLDAPEIQVANYPALAKPKPKDNRTIYQRISKSLKLVQVSHIYFKNVTLRYVSYKSTKPAITAFKDLDFNATDLLIDSATQFDKNRFLFCQELGLQLRNYRGRAADALYGYEAKLIDFSTRTRKLKVTNFSLIPLQTPASFFKKTYSDRFTLRANILQLNNFDFEIFNKDHTIKANSVELSKGSIQVFSNPRTDPKGFRMDKASTFPHKNIHQLPVQVKIDTVKIRKYQVYYKEYSTKTKRSGYISFNQINGQLYNVANAPATIAKNHLCKAKFEALFMNRAPMAVSFIFNLKDSLYSYSYKGWAGPISMPVVNVATIPLSSLNIKSGRVKRIDFDINANRKLATGKVTLLYNNLNIELLKADTAQLKMRGLALASLALNALILKNNNPDKPGEQPRTANVIYLRPKNYPFFETLWRTLLFGIKKSAGLDFQAQRDADIKQSEKEKKEYLKKHKKEAKQKQKEEKKRLKELKKQREEAREKAKNN